MKWVSGISLRAKLTLTLGAVVFVTFATLGFLRYRTVSYRAARAFERNLLEDARRFASRVQVTEEDLTIDTHDLLPAEAFVLETLKLLLFVTDEHGHVAHRHSLSPAVQGLLERGLLAGVAQETAGFERVDAGDDESYLFVSLRPPGAGAAGSFTLHLGRSTSTLDGVLEEYYLVWLTSVPLVVALSVGLSWFLGGRALRPFESVARIAERVNLQNLNTRIDVPDQEREVQRLVDAFNAMIYRLNLSFQQLRQFNADAAHELRTPLAILQGESELALEARDVPEEVRSVLESNLEELERLRRIVNDLLTLSEADAGKRILDLKTVELAPLLADLADQMHVIASERGIRITHSELAPVMVEADDLWLRRAVLNVLDNAIKYSSDNSSVEVRAERVDSDVRVVVRDEGMGIAQSDLPRVFDRLFRADPARTRKGGGAGLGLSLVRWIIEAHGGKVAVESELDRGTTVVLLLPVSKARPSSEAS